MGKMILVMDDPKFCCNCPLAKSKKHNITKEEHWVCGIGHSDKYGWVWEPVDMDSDTKPDWCLLKPAPEKYDLENVLYTRDWDGEYEHGYNACVDEILGN